ncbi:Uncharacterised protein [uncultured archaeon]|nr:Uncharacterised protein [uncultured archaeon]
MEAVVSLAMLCIFLAAVYLQIGIRDEQARFVSQRAADGADCERLSWGLSKVNSSGPNVQVEAMISSNALVRGNSITVGGASCYFSGSDASASLQPGGVIVKKEGGIVSVANK